MRLVLLLLLSLPTFSLTAQQVGGLSGSVTDEQTLARLAGVSITLYKQGKANFMITNSSGLFTIPDAAAIDSIKFSMIGHVNKIYSRDSLTQKNRLNVSMKIISTPLDEITIKPLSAIEIVDKAIQATKAFLPKSDFETLLFYRETIKEKEQYFSVAEAIFRSQYMQRDQSLKLNLVRGRSKEDVSYTRLFEDFHPGGGPEGITENSFSVAFPDFLNPKKMKWFNYKKEHPIAFGDKVLEVISFDQKPGVKDALEKGRLFIDREDFAVLRYEAESSPLGMPYIKNLIGTDKIIAEILNIDFKRKGWKKNVSFIKANGSLVMSQANATYLIGYKQPKKELDLDLTIYTELAATHQLLPVTHPIKKEESWKRKNIIANLPTDFDPGFWGSYNIISPTEEVINIMGAIGKRNQDETVPGKLSGDWQYFGRDFFTGYQHHDSITLIPIMKASWQDDETGGMIFQNVNGDFTLETDVSIVKRSDGTQLPDNGFQQAGIIIRNDSSKEEQSILLCIGTGGNGQAKYFLRNTERGRSKGPVDKIDGLNYSLRLEKNDGIFTAFYKSQNDREWKKTASYKTSMQNGTLQAGLVVMARFAGDGPKAKPDMKAHFTNFKILPN